MTPRQLIIGKMYNYIVSKEVQAMYWHILALHLRTTGPCNPRLTIIIFLELQPYELSCLNSNKYNWSQSLHYWKLGLCRVFLHSAKGHKHSAKTLPSVALGKVRSAKFYSAKGLCRAFFLVPLGKIIKFFAECCFRRSAKNFYR
jgi:hypothetical protein